MAAGESPRPVNRKADDGGSANGVPVVSPPGPPMPLARPPAPGPAVPPPEDRPAKGPVKLTKKQKKQLKDNHRQLDSWERYRALTDVLDEALDLVALAEINRAKYTALRRLYKGLHIMIFMGAGLLLFGAIAYFFAGGAQAGFGKHVKFKGKSAQTSGEASSPARDWKEHPALVERTTSAEVVGLGDVHGGYDRLVSLLTAAGLIKSDGQSRGGYAWAGGKRVLVSVGDLINKGDKSIEVMDLMRALQEQAPHSGGEVIVTCGNHEVEFLGKPERRKAEEFASELQAKGIDPEAVAAGQNEYGVWMRNLPVA